MPSFPSFSDPQSSSSSSAFPHTPSGQTNAASTQPPSFFSAGSPQGPGSTAQPVSGSGGFSLSGTYNGAYGAEPQGAVTPAQSAMTPVAATGPTLKRAWTPKRLILFIGSLLLTIVAVVIVCVAIPETIAGTNLLRDSLAAQLSLIRTLILVSAFVGVVGFVLACVLAADKAHRVHGLIAIGAAILGAIIAIPLGITTNLNATQEAVSANVVAVFDRYAPEDLTLDNVDEVENQLRTLADNAGTNPETIYESVPESVKSHIPSEVRRELESAISRH